MRLDLSKEQLETIISSLDSTINNLTSEKDELEGSVRDIIEEAIAVKTATVLYLKEYISRKDERQILK